MFGLALAVVAIAIPDSLNPSLIVTDVYFAIGEHPFRRTLAFAMAAFVVTLAAGLLIALGLGDLIISLLPKLSHQVKWDVLTCVGVLMVAAGVAIWLRRHQLGASEPPSKHAHHGSGSSAALAGAGIAGVEILTAFPYFGAIALIVGASVSGTSKVALLVLYCVVYVLPLIAIVVACGVLNAQQRQRIAPVGDWIAMRWPIVAAPLVMLVGIALSIYGVVQLT